MSEKEELVYINCFYYGFYVQKSILDNYNVKFEYLDKKTKEIMNKNKKVILNNQLTNSDSILEKINQQFNDFINFNDSNHSNDSNDTYNSNDYDESNYLNNNNNNNYSNTLYLFRVLEQLNSCNLIIYNSCNLSVIYNLLMYYK